MTEIQYMAKALDLQNAAYINGNFGSDVNNVLREVKESLRAYTNNNYDRALSLFSTVLSNISNIKNDAQKLSTVKNWLALYKGQPNTPSTTLSDRAAENSGFLTSFFKSGKKTEEKNRQAAVMSCLDQLQTKMQKGLSVLSSLGVSPNEFIRINNDGVSAIKNSDNPSVTFKAVSQLLDNYLQSVQNTANSKKENSPSGSQTSQTNSPSGSVSGFSSEGSVITPDDLGFQKADLEQIGLIDKILKFLFNL